MSLIIIYLTNMILGSIVISVTIVLGQSKNYKTYHFQFQSTPELENTSLPLHIRSKYNQAEQQQGSSDKG